MEDFDDLKDKLKAMQHNIAEIKRLLKIEKENKSLKIPREVFELQKETTKYAKQVSKIFKDFSYGTDFNEMTKHRLLLCDFLTALSNFSSLQRKIIDSAVVDSVDSGRISQFDDIITSLSPLISDNRSQFWPTLGFLTLGIAIIGGITILRAATN